MTDNSIRERPQGAGCMQPVPCVSAARQAAVASGRSGGGPPPRQNPYDQALEKGMDVLSSRPVSRDRLSQLGADLTGHAIHLQVLNQSLRVDLDLRRVSIEGSGTARAAWAVLVVHYLCADDLTPDLREVSFSDFHDGRSYLSVFTKRITGRFLATVGRSALQFERAAVGAGGVRVSGSGLGYCFRVLPRVPITLIRYEGDDEVTPGASIIYRADAEHLLPAEDRVVAAEVLLDTLSGKPLSECGGPSEQRL